MKRIITLVLVLLFAMTVFAGCAKTETEAPMDKAPAADATATTEETEALSGKLVVWLWDTGFNGNAMEKAAAIYKQTNPNFELEIVDQGDWDTVQIQLITIASSGNYDELPDIFLIQDNAFQKNYISFPDLFADLSDTSIDFSQFAQGKVGYSVVDGKNFGVPFDNGAVIYGYRTDVLAEAGYTIDDFTDITWSTWLEQAKVVLDKTGHPLLSAMSGSPDVINMMMQSAGTSMFNEDGTPNIVGNDVLYEVADIYMQMKADGTYEEWTDWSGFIDSFTSGSVAGTMTGCWIVSSIKSAEDQAGLWQIANMPKLDNVAGATNYSNNGGSSWVVTPNADLALAADFFSKTFGGSTDLYDEIAPTGALGTYLPSADSSVYAQPDDFFGGQPIMSMITEYAGYVPRITGGAYYYDARDAVATAIIQIEQGMDREEAFQQAEDAVNFAMGN